MSFDDLKDWYFGLTYDDPEYLRDIKRVRSLAVCKLTCRRRQYQNGMHEHSCWKVDKRIPPLFFSSLLHNVEMLDSENINTIYIYIILINKNN